MVHSWEISVSILGLEAGYPDQCFTIFLSDSRYTLGQYCKTTHVRVLPHPFNSTRRYIICVVDEVSLNK